MRLVKHVISVGDVKHAYKIFVGKYEDKNPIALINVDGNMILNWVLKK
jgi:hypothetical protein